MEETKLLRNYSDILSVREVQEILGGVSRQLVYRLLKQGKLNGRKIGREYRILKVSVINYFCADSFLP